MLRFGVFELNRKTGELHKSGYKIALRPQAARVLTLLAERPAQLVTRDQIKDGIWGTEISVDFERGLNQCIRQIRAALDDDAETPRYIETLPRLGYRFIAPIREKNAGAGLGEQVPAFNKAFDAPSDSGRSSAVIATRSESRRLFWWFVAAFFLILSVLSATFGFLTRTGNPIPTPTMTRLTWDSGLTTDPALSPDGRLLAYASDRSGEGHLDIYVQQVGGGEPLRLTSGPGDKDDPAFSPDGTSIAFDSVDSGGIYVVSALGGPARKLVSEGRGPKFSPDGRWIAYWVGGLGAVTLNTHGETSIHVVASGGGLSRQIRPDFIGATHPIWSPDGQHLLFLGNPDNSKPPEESVDWWVTPLATGPALKTGVLETTRKAKLASDFQAYPWAVIPAAWDPRGNWILFSARIGDSIDLWRIGISPTTFRVDGSPQRLTSAPTREESLSLSSGSNGRIRVAFASMRQNLSIWSLPIQLNEGKVTGDLQQLTRDAAGDFMPDVSHDGSRLAFVSAKPDNQEIWVKDLRDGRESALTATRALKYEPVFSPDDAQISFSETASWSVYVVPSTGGNPEMVCENCGEVTDWSADGKRLLGNTLDGRAWLLDLTSHRKRDLLATLHWVATDSFSPDNRWFTFIDVHEAFHHAYIAPVRNTPVPESEWIDLMDGEAETWSPNGNLIFATSERDGHLCIWTQRLDPVTKRPVGAPFAVFHSHNPRLSLANQTEVTLGLAGNRMVFSMGERTGNIWMAEWNEQ